MCQEKELTREELDEEMIRIGKLILSPEQLPLGYLTRYKRNLEIDLANVSVLLEKHKRDS